MDFIKDFWGFLLSIIIFLGILFVAFYCEDEKRQRLVNQCMADGRKEYECESMFRTTHSTSYIPIVVPR